jgi:hypothetical protein
MIHFPILMTIRRNITYETGEGRGKTFHLTAYRLWPSISCPYMGTFHSRYGIEDTG